jgi:hypothetical protein
MRGAIVARQSTATVALSSRYARWQRSKEGLVHGSATGVMNAVQKAQVTGSNPNPLDPFRLYAYIIMFCLALALGRSQGRQRLKRTPIQRPEGWAAEVRMESVAANWPNYVIMP